MLLGNYKMHMFFGPLMQLVSRNGLLESEQVFLIKAVGLIDYLPPSIFAGGLRPEHGKVVRRKLKIVVAFSIGEEKVGTFIAFSDSLFFKNQMRRGKDGRKVMLQRFASTRFAAIENLVGKRNKGFAAFKGVCICWVIHLLLKAAEQAGFCVVPMQKYRVRVVCYATIRNFVGCDLKSLYLCFRVSLKKNKKILTK